jgi:hypothetical protein
MIDMYRFQYFLSVVPTTYIADEFGRKMIETNQYAVTKQGRPSAGKMGQEVPGTISTPNPTNEQGYFSNMMLNHYK